MMLHPGPHTPARWDEIEASLKAALRDAIRSHSGTLADRYRAELLELAAMRFAADVPEQRQP